MTPNQSIKNLKALCESGTPEQEIREKIAVLTEQRIDEIRNAPTEVRITGTSYYVSGTGDDANDGKSPETPWKTLERVTKADELMPGDGVFFKRGELFRGQVFAHAGVTYSAYGEGAKPRLYGWDRNSASPALWIPTDEPYVWAYTEKCELDIGVIVFDEKDFCRKVYQSNFLEDGTQQDYRTKAPFRDYHDLTEDKSFWHDDETKTLYLRYEKGNPAIFAGDIEMTKRESVFRVDCKPDVTIDNLCIGFGNFGISSSTVKGLTVQNCEIKWIGGCIQSRWKKDDPRMYHIPYGNGIEIYGGAKDFTVDNCYIWQNYDAAATNQCSSNKYKIDNKCVRYTNNVFENCVYSVEIFFGYHKDPESDEVYTRRNDDTLIENNIMWKAGGFGHVARIDPGCTSFIRCGTIVPDTTDFVVRNNIFDRSRNRIVLTVTTPGDGGSMAQYYDNIYVQKKGNTFAVRLGVVYKTDENLAENLEKTGTEHNPTYIFVEDNGFDDYE